MPSWFNKSSGFGFLGLVSLGITLTPSGIQAQDTLRTAVPAVEISAFRAPIEPESIPAAWTVADSAWLHRGASPDVSEAISASPAAWMETRGSGGSRRVQMRSSGLRSPFAVRNVTMIQDGFILTNADGTSPLEWWMPALLDRIEVLPGPTGAIWGGGYGGVMTASSRPAPTNAGFSHEASLRWAPPASGATPASRGEGEASVFLRQAGLNGNGRTLGFVQQVNEGFRDQEANRRSQLDFHQRFQASTDRGRRESHIWVGGLAARWELPGSVDAATADTLPSFAPGAPFDAAVDRRSGLLGLSHISDFGRGRWGVWVLGQTSNKINPYGTSNFYKGYKIESEQNLSIRGQFLQRLSRAGAAWNLTAEASVIVLVDGLDVQEYDWVDGVPSEARIYDLHASTRRIWSGGTLSASGPRGLRCDLQLAVERFARKLDGLGGGSGAELLFSDYADLRALPRVSLATPWRWNGRSLPGVWGLSFGMGTSDPTGFELVDPESATLTDLTPESAQSLELGWRSEHLAATLYAMQVRDAIVTIPGANDVPVTSNVGLHNMQGLEFSVNHSWTSLDGKRSLGHQTSGSWTLHRNGLSGKRLPGTPIERLQSRWLGASETGWSADVLMSYRGRIPLNDANSSFADAVGLVDFLVGKLLKGGLEIKMGCRNLTDVQTSNWWQLNAFGGRYWNPAPGRQFWLQLTWRRR